MSLAHLKKNSTGGIALLQKRLNEMKSKKSDSGDNYWKLSVDTADVGSAEIRLLPAIEGEDYPFVKIADYGIGVFHQSIGKKKWYIHRSLENIGQKDPVKDEYWALHNTGIKENKEAAKLIRDRVSYIVWIYVVDDKNAPENNGKVMKAKLSPSIWKFVEDKLTPQFDDEDAINVFNPWEGATLKIRAFNGSNGMRTYEKTVWLNPGPLFKDDEKLEAVFEQVKGLADETDPNSKHYSKSYDELSVKLAEVLGRPLVKDQKDDVDNASALANAFNDDEEDEVQPTPTRKPNVEENDEDLDTLIGSKVPSNDVDDDELDALLND